MKKFQDTKWLLLAIIVIAITATIIIKTLEYFFGVATVFFGAVVLMPVCFVWTLLTNK